MNQRLRFEILPPLTTYAEIDPPGRSWAGGQAREDRMLRLLLLLHDEPIAFSALGDALGIEPKVTKRVINTLRKMLADTGAREPDQRPGARGDGRFFDGDGSVGQFRLRNDELDFDEIDSASQLIQSIADLPTSRSELLHEYDVTSRQLGLFETSTLPYDLDAFAVRVLERGHVRLSEAIVDRQRRIEQTIYRLKRKSAILAYGLNNLTDAALHASSLRDHELEDGRGSTVYTVPDDSLARIEHRAFLVGQRVHGLTRATWSVAFERFFGSTFIVEPQEHKDTGGVLDLSPSIEDQARVIEEFLALTAFVPDNAAPIPPDPADTLGALLADEDEETRRAAGEMIRMLATGLEVPGRLVQEHRYVVRVEPTTVDGGNETSNWKITTEIAQTRRLPLGEHCWFSVAMDQAALQREYSDEGCLLRELVPPLNSESSEAWADRIEVECWARVGIGGTFGRAERDRHGDVVRFRFQIPEALRGEWSRISVMAEFPLATAQPIFPVFFGSYHCIGGFTMVFEVNSPEVYMIECWPFMVRPDLRTLDRPFTPSHNRYELEVNDQIVLPGAGAVFTWELAQPFAGELGDR